VIVGQSADGFIADEYGRSCRDARAARDQLSGVRPQLLLGMRLLFRKPLERRFHLSPCS
jgi:hypothetical protein